MIVLRPDLIDYEANMQFDMVIVAYDLVMPVNQRRQVKLIVIIVFRIKAPLSIFFYYDYVLIMLGNNSLYCWCERYK